MTSQNNGHTPEFRMATRDTTVTTDERAALTDADLMLLSAFVDGALEPADEATLLARLDVEPGLTDALAELAALRGAMAGKVPAIDIADRVMAVVAPEELSATENGALLGGMLLADGEAPSSRIPIAPAADDAVYGFLRATEVVRSALQALPALPRSAAPTVETALSDDERALDLAMQLLDGESSAAAVDGLAALLDDTVHGARRVDDVTAFALASARVGQELRSAAVSPLAAHAGERALQALTAMSPEPVHASGGGRSPLREPRAPLFERVTRLFPVGVALAALALFVVLARVDSGEERSDPTEPATDTLALAPFDVLPDNTSTVETIETGSGAAVVFSTSASHITIIWVGGAGTSEQGT